MMEMNHYDEESKNKTYYNPYKKKIPIGLIVFVVCAIAFEFTCIYFIVKPAKRETETQTAKEQYVKELENKLKYYENNFENYYLINKKDTKFIKKIKLDTSNIKTEFYGK